MKKVFYFIGAGLIIGGIAASAVYLLNSKKKKKCDSSNAHKVSDEEITPVDKEALREVTVTQDEPVYENFKNSVIGSVCSRHKSAAQIMSDSSKTICRNVKVSDDTNDEIDAVSAELDKMLSED